MRKTIRILIVDDNYLARQTIKNILSSPVCRFTETESSDEALVFIQERTFDIIIFDVNLPGIRTGVDIFEKAKQMGSTLPPVIFLTGTFDDVTEKKARELGAANFLKKTPLSAQKLRKAVSRALRVHAHHDPTISFA